MTNTPRTNEAPSLAVQAEQENSSLLDLFKRQIREVASNVRESVTTWVNRFGSYYRSQGRATTVEAAREMEMLIAEATETGSNLLENLPTLDHQETTSRLNGMPKARMPGDHFNIDGVKWVFFDHREGDVYQEDWAIGIGPEGKIYWYKNLTQDHQLEDYGIQPVSTVGGVKKETFRFDNINDLLKVMAWEQDAVGGMKYYNPQRDEAWIKPSFIKPKDAVCSLLELGQGTLDLEDPEYQRRGGQGPRFRHVSPADEKRIVQIKTAAKDW
ncbi:hypothetical protein KKB83_03485 [Patescibacteria group bacterium]|nr:hypothetical protein [Patescibacteria group bacterium]